MACSQHCYQTPPQCVMSGSHGEIATVNVNSCENSRPILTESVPNHSLCSCHLDLYHQRLSLPINLYSTSAFYAGDQYSMGSDHTLCTVNGLKENAEAWRTLQYPVYSTYDPSGLVSYPFLAGYNVDLSAARRKNATRETTSTLKAWLSEHRKNPYPTKGEKIMLAIITKMTLTQVSTWFANARRRLKKENKMTWEPRNRCDEDDVEDGNIGSEEEPDQSNGEGENVKKVVDSVAQDRNQSAADVTESRKSPCSNLSKSCKPQIWSIVDIATSPERSFNPNTSAWCAVTVTSTGCSDSLPTISSLNRLRTAVTTYDPTSGQNLTVPTQNTSSPGN